MCQHVRVCQRGWAGRPWARYPKALTFIDGPWALPAHLNPSLLSMGPGQPNPSLLLAGPLASISRAGPRNSSRRNSAAKKRATVTAAPYFPRFGALPIWQTLRCFFDLASQYKLLRKLWRWIDFSFVVQNLGPRPGESHLASEDLEKYLTPETYSGPQSSQTEPTDALAWL